MIFREGREISGIRFGGRLLSAVHVGARLVWQAEQLLWRGLLAEHEAGEAL